MPYQVSSKFHSKDKDKKFITRLRDWMDDFQFDAGLNEFLSLREIKEGEFADLVCKILHTCEAAEGKWTIFIWDGTDAPPVGIQKRLEDEKQDPLPLGLNPSLLNRDTLCTFPPIGTILPVDIDQGNEKFGLHLLVTGRWVRFLNIKCEVHFGLWRGVLVPSSRLRFVPDEAQVVVHRRRLFGERLTNKWDRMPTASFPWPSQITVTDNGSAGFLTLMDILTCSQVTCKFKCIVRVVAACPWQAEDFLSPRGIYRIRLTLEDPTARIHAFVYAEDGKKFFGGYPTIDVMRRKINKLLGITKGEDGKEIVGAPRNPPWIQCCIKSYYQTKSDRWGSRKYRIFGTRLLDE